MRGTVRQGRAGGGMGGEEKRKKKEEGKVGEEGEGA